MQEKKVVQIGIIGFGFMGRTHIECYKANPSAKVTRIVALEPIKKDMAGGNMATGQNIDIGDAVVSDDWHSIVDDPAIDLVDICTPTHTHAGIALAALKAGKNVAVEKPMARTLSEAKALVTAARKSKKILHVGHVIHYWGQYVALEKFIKSGELGKWQYARFERHGGRPGWSAGGWLADAAKSGGAVLDMHIHDVDAALWLLGKPKKIEAVGASDGPLPMSIDATWTYPGSRQAHLHGRWDRQGGAPFRYAYYVEFEKGTVWCDSAQCGGVNLVQGAKSTPVDYEQKSGFQLQTNELIDAVAKKALSTRVEPAVAYRTLEITLIHLRHVEKSSGNPNSSSNRRPARRARVR
jgi:predicted dehydrogenase